MPHPQARGMGENRKTKARKLIGQDTGILIGEGRKRKKYANEAKKITQRQTDVQTVSAPCTTHLEKHPQTPSSAQCLLLHYDITCYWNILLASLGQISWLCLLLISRPPFSQLTGLGAESEKEKALMLCNHCSAMAKTLLCYQPWFSHKSKTPTQRLLWRKLTASGLHKVHSVVWIALHSVCMSTHTELSSRFSDALEKIL